VLAAGKAKGQPEEKPPEARRRVGMPFGVEGDGCVLDELESVRKADQYQNNATEKRFKKWNGAKEATGRRNNGPSLIPRI
jgi:hypothetical protein